MSDVVKTPDNVMMLTPNEVRQVEELLTGEGIPNVALVEAFEAVRRSEEDNERIGKMDLRSEAENAWKGHQVSFYAAATAGERREFIHGYEARAAEDKPDHSRQEQDLIDNIRDLEARLAEKAAENPELRLLSDRFQTSRSLINRRLVVLEDAARKAGLDV